MIAGLRTRVSDARVVRASSGYLESPFASLQLLLCAGGGLLLFGLMMSASTTISSSQHTAGTAMWTQLIRELAYLFLSIPVFWLAVKLPPRWYRRLAYPALIVAILVLAGVLAPGIGVTINGARRWILLGPLTAQPSEFAKIAVLLWGADLLARKHELGTLTRARHILIPLVPVFAAIIALVMMEPDLGTTLCFVLLLLGLLWMVGLPMRYFAAVLVMVGGAVTALALAEPYRLQRITTFLHPNLDPGDTGYHTIQGLYALASGGWFGVGLGQGTSKYGWVPNANTDYVFAVVGEELGLLGSVVVLLLFAGFTFSAIRVASRSGDSFVRLVASGTAVWISGQALINVGYVTALLPVTGIPLPFISNGGTSLILTCAVLGMLVSFARHEPAAVAAVSQLQSQGRLPSWVGRLRLDSVRAIEPARPRKVRSKPGAPTGQRGGVQRPVVSRPVVQRPAASGPAVPRQGDQRPAVPRQGVQRPAAPRAVVPRQGEQRPAAPRARRGA